MKYSLHEYLEAEIPMIKGKKGLKRLVLFFKAMRYYPNYHALFLLRYCYVYSSAKGLRKYFCIHYKRMLINRYGIFFNVNENTNIGIGLTLPHPVSIVFGEGVSIGDNCTIYQNVTFGAKKRISHSAEKSDTSIRYPLIGNNCVFYAGAVIIGGIRIANGTQVGANAVLMINTEENGIYAGIPATRKR